MTHLPLWGRLVAMLTVDWLIELAHTAVAPAYTLAAALSLAEAVLDGAIVDLGIGRDNSYPLAELLVARNVPFAFATGRTDSELDCAYRSTPYQSKPYRFESFQQAVQALLRTADR